MYVGGWVDLFVGEDKGGGEIVCVCVCLCVCRLLPGPKVCVCHVVCACLHLCLYLPTPTPIHPTPPTQVSGGVWTLMRKYFYQAAALSRWSVVSFCTKRRLSEDDVHRYIEGLRDALEKTGRWVGVTIGEWGACV
jgi:hypothetical protein